MNILLSDDELSCKITQTLITQMKHGWGYMKITGACKMPNM